MADEKLVFNNNMAVFGWAFMALWTGMLLLFTGLFLRDGGFHQFDPLVEVGIMGLFWLFGSGGCAYFFGIPRVRVSVDAGQVVVRERWAVRSRIEQFPLSQLGAPYLQKEVDSEGDPYFRCMIKLPSGRTVAIREDSDKPTVEAARERLVTMLDAQA